MKSSLPVELLMTYYLFGRAVIYGIYPKLKRIVSKNPLLDIYSHVFQSTGPAESAIKPDHQQALLHILIRLCNRYEYRIAPPPSQGPPRNHRPSNLAAIFVFQHGSFTRKPHCTGRLSIALLQHCTLYTSERSWSRQEKSSSKQACVLLYDTCSSCEAKFHLRLESDKL
jgi:hypothetical protein